MWKPLEKLGGALLSTRATANTKGKKPHGERGQLDTGQSRRAGTFGVREGSVNCKYRRFWGAEENREQRLEGR